MIKDGLFEKFPMEAVFGMHNWPGGQVGRFAVSPGPVMASTAEFKITIRGKGGHGAMPHLGTDPVPIACQIVQAFQTIVSRNIKPIDAGVVSVTMIHSGEATNVIPRQLRAAGHGAGLPRGGAGPDRAAHEAHRGAHLPGARGDLRIRVQRNYPATVNSAARRTSRAR
jgi:hippurate hydrolase